jgi:Homeodomain-like domain
MNSPLSVLAGAARELVVSGELEPAEALWLVINPTDDLIEAASTFTREHGQPGPRPPEVRQRALELVAGGASWAEAARAVGVSKAAVGGWVRAESSSSGLSN